ncbi:MAG: DNA-formamidopyrimidine glycosylase family protein [Chloroflexota bacterium]
MPEIPDLEGYATYFNKRLPGLTITTAERPLAWIVREVKENYEERLPGQTFGQVHRHAKMLFFELEGGDNLVVHAMLTGRYQLVTPETKLRAATAWVLGLDDGMQLRYFDDRRMGRTFVAKPEEFAEKLPRWTEMGPDVMSAELTEDAFAEIMKKQRGMIKNIITNERIIAGIGNAYSDEVLWEARLHPFRKRGDIPEENIRELYRSIRRVMEWATPIVEQQLEEKGLPVKMYRDHLRVHARREGTLCPRDEHRISSITTGGKETNFCRGCQE